MTEATEGAEGSAYVSAINEVSQWVLPLTLSREFDNQTTINVEEPMVHSNIDDHHMVCLIIPYARYSNFESRLSGGVKCYGRCVNSALNSMTFAATAALYWVKLITKLD